MDLYLTSEVNTVVEALDTLLDALGQENALFADAVAGRGFRLAYGSDEKKVVVSVIGPAGGAFPVASIDADPFSPTYGLVGAPVPIAGLYATPGQTH